LLKEYEARLERFATLPQDAITIKPKITNRQMVVSCGTPFLGLVRLAVKSRKSAGIWRNLNRFLRFHDTPGVTEIGFARRIFAEFAHPARMRPVLLHAVAIDHVRALETIALAISRPE